MIDKLDISGVNVDADEKLKKYVTKIVNKLERYIPRKEREGTHVDVKLKEHKKQKNRQYTAEIIIHMPHEKIAAKESTINMYAAIDIVEAKLRNQLKKYKGTHNNPRFYQRVRAKFRRNNPDLDKKK